MKLKTLPIYLLLLTGVITSSCNKFLDEIPKGVVIPNTLADYQALLSNMNEIGRASNNQFFVTDEIELPASLRAVATGYSGRYAINAYDFKDEYYDMSENDDDWNAAYRAIYIFNTVIDGIKSNKEQNQALKNQLLGEALAHRGFSFLMLVNQYAKHYSNTSAQDLGVPMPLRPDINALLHRSTVTEVYKQIEEDLLKSIPLLPKKATYSYRPSQAAAHGILSRMYLYQRKWDKALEHASLAFQINNFIYDYNTFTLSNPNNPVSSQVSGYPSSGIDKKHLIFHKNLRIVGAFNYNFMLSKDQEALFEEGDLRKLFGTTPMDYYAKPLPGISVMELKPVYDYQNGGITTQELILNRAESNARLGNLNESINDLNTLRKNRIKKDIYEDLNLNDQAEILKQVLKERRIKLAFTGLRLADIKRFNLEGQEISITHGDVTIGPKDPKIIFPIAPKIMSINPNLIQNPRY